MAAILTSEDRIRVSDDVAGVTSGLIAAMVNSNMVTKEALPGLIKEIHGAVIDISIQTASLLYRIDPPSSPPGQAQSDRRPVSPEAISRAVRGLMAGSTAEVEPATPHQVRVPQTASPRTPLPTPPVLPISDVKARAEVPLPKQVPQQAVLPFAPSPAPAVARSKAAPKVSPAWGGEERRARPVQSRKVINPALPQKLTSIEEALNIDFIVCLEDGRKVKDLREHLAKLKMTPDQYREKWKLPSEYPMIAPAAIVKKTDRRLETFELDLVTGRIRKSR